MIEASDLWKSYKKHEALRGLSLHVPEGAAYAFIGANGAGKTTTIKILMNLFTADMGEASILGVDTTRLGAREFATIGYVSENQRMPACLRLGEYLAYLRSLYPTWDRDLEDAFCKTYALDTEMRIGDLSHGMRMKFALTCAQAFRPKLLILDEPLSGIDPLVRDELLAGLLAQAGECTIFISSHELSEIEGLVSHVGYVESGRLLFEQSVEVLQQRFREVEVVLGGEAVLPKIVPSHWLNPSVSGSVLHFVDSAYEAAALNAELQGMFADIRRIEVRPMSLRSVFTAQAAAMRSNGG